ncbi:MAG: hypothetical protein EZS28_045699 [Streblomastix strix]|uniref:Uncharacterized protein n=1 Tax=Streblomastix strix TaxID=222440 RepID=A0A5J4TMX3_9EUKA|nr:MAG: hypothetical protein EZS28_045699 [Streblomastix strix]
MRASVALVDCCVSAVSCALPSPWLLLRVVQLLPLALPTVSPRKNRFATFPIQIAQPRASVLLLSRSVVPPLVLRLFSQGPLDLSPSSGGTAATVQTATGNTDIDRKTRLDDNSEIQFVHVHKHIRHDLQGKYDSSADGHDRAREPIENTTITCNTSRIQQLNAEVVTSTTPDRKSTSSVCGHVTNENCRFYRRTGLRTEKADCATTHRHDQEQAGENATRIGSGSSEKTDTRNPTDCLFTTTESTTVVELESIRTAEPILQSTPSTVGIGIVTTTTPLPILRAANAIPDLTSSVPNYPATKPIFSNSEPTVNTIK